MFNELNENNFLLFAAKHYINPYCMDVEEFYDDLKHIKYLKRLIRKYEKDGVLKSRLMLNHLVILYNVFEAEAMTAMLRFRLSGYEHFFKPFLDYLGYWNTKEDIPIDPNVVEELRKI